MTNKASKTGKLSRVVKDVIGVIAFAAVLVPASAVDSHYGK